MDAAHNPAGAQALADYLHAAHVTPVPIVLAVMQDKDIDGIIRALAPAASMFVATEVGLERCTRAAELAARILRAWPTTRSVSVGDAKRAVTVALENSGRAVIAGSIFLVGPARARLIAEGATSVDHPP